MKQVLSQMVLMCTVFIISSTYTKAQSKSNNPSNTAQESVVKSVTLAEPGTFYVLSTRKKKELFTNEKYIQLRMIAAENRKADKEIRLSINDMTDIVILPFSKINDPNFVPYTTLYIND